MPLNKTYPSWQVLLLQIIMGGISICRGWVPLNMIFPQWPGPLTKTILGCISIFWGWMPLNQTYNQWTGLVIKSVLGGIGIFCDWMTLNTTYPHWPGSLSKTILECICIFNKRKSLVAQTYRTRCFGGPAEMSSQNSKYIRQNCCFNLIHNLLNFPDKNSVATRPRYNAQFIGFFQHFESIVSEVPQGERFRPPIISSNYN